MSSEVVIFTLNGCSHCIDLKDKLNDVSIPFTEIEITNNQKLWDKVVNQTGHNVLPTIFIKKQNTDTGPVLIPGKDFNNVNEVIPKIKIHL
jgi:glutaredoxin